MYIHPSKYLIYLAHPRTASASTAEALTKIGFEKPPGRDHHCRLHGPGSPIPPELRDEWIVFTTIRNHFDAAVSWGYMDSNNPSTIPWSKGFFKRALETPWVGANTMWFHTESDAFLRYENLLEDLEIFLGGFDLELPELPHLNASDRKGKHYSEYYDFESRDYVEKRFQDELRHFGYKFESSLDKPSTV